MTFFLAMLKSGGGNNGSTAILKALSNSAGIILADSGLQSSKQGLVLHSISMTLKFSSIMKSKPNISNECCLRFASILVKVAINASVTSRLIWGSMVFSIEMFRSGNACSRYF